MSINDRKEITNTMKISCRLWQMENVFIRPVLGIIPH